MFSFEGGVEVLVKKINGFFISSIENDFDGILQVNADFVGFQVVLRFDCESVSCLLLLAFQTENAADVVRCASWGFFSYCKVACLFFD